MTQSTAPRSTSPLPRALLWAVVGLVVAAFIVWALVRSLQPPDALGAAIKSDRYQAVFLTNGQVYFGKLSSPGGGFYDLTHVYYLTTSNVGKGKGPTPRLNKLTGDLHGPEDEVIISGRQILYVENLNPNGRAARILSGSAP